MESKVETNKTNQRDQSPNDVYLHEDTPIYSRANHDISDSISQFNHINGRDKRFDISDSELIITSSTQNINQNSFCTSLDQVNKKSIFNLPKIDKRKTDLLTPQNDPSKSKKIVNKN